MLILGLNAYHGDASACIIRDGEIIAAVEEERFRRIKHWAGFPSESIHYCIKEAGARLADVDHIALNSDPKAAIFRKIEYAVRRPLNFNLIMARVKNQKKRHSVHSELARAFPGEGFKGEVHRVEHHLAHLASCFLVSPFKQAVTVSVDGFGDFSSAAWGIGRNSKIDIDSRVYFPNSLGIFYQAMTQFLGFPHYGDEYKVMGLAPYGKPTFMDEMRRIVKLNSDGSFELELDYFKHHREKIDYAWSGGGPTIGRLFSDKLQTLLGPARAKDDPLEDKHRDIAHSVQKMYEEAFFNLLNAAHRRYGLDDLTIAGGCGMNSVANGKVRANTPFKRVYIQSAAGDAGGAVGAAMQVWTTLASASAPACKGTSVLFGERVPGRHVMDHAYLGPGANADEIKAVLDVRASEMKEAGCRVSHITDWAELCQRTATAVANGQVIGWFQGRMEWGPRALGNRSILCDPRRGDMKDILNLKIKRRESFRPFAPSIQREYVADWFEDDDEVPFMMKVLTIRSERRAQIPAVTHVDGTGRLQTVYRETNTRYWDLIEAFRVITGVPMVLNTSFNENEPVVCRPAEALDCFLRTKMDVLVLGDMFVQRE